MKNLVVLFIILSALTGCGLGEKLCPRNGVPMVCNMLVGEELQDRVDNIEDTQRDILNRLTDIDNKLLNLVDNTTLQSMLTQVSNDLRTELNNSSTSYTDTQVSNLSQVVDQLGLGVAEVVDPCGAETAYDEILVKLSNGTFIAFFESDNKRRLSVLIENATYETTDGTNCKFKVVNKIVVEL